VWQHAQCDIKECQSVGNVWLLWYCQMVYLQLLGQGCYKCHLPANLETFFKRNMLYAVSCYLVACYIPAFLNFCSKQPNPCIMSTTSHIPCISAVFSLANYMSYPPQLSSAAVMRQPVSISNRTKDFPALCSAWAGC
jgi:hypothetical protein